MAGMTHGPQTGRRDQLVFAAILIIIGIAGFIIQATEEQIDAGGIVVLVIGLGLLGAFAYTRQYGYLISGGILTGLGAGIALQEAFALTSGSSGGVIVLGLGLGFVSIWVIGLIVQVAQHHWWPLIPGGILSAVGVALLTETTGLLDFWYLAIIAVGVIVLGLALLQGRERA
jgi:hypothetical protein